MSDARALTFDGNSDSPVGPPLACAACGMGYVRVVGSPVFGGPEVVETDDYEGRLGFRGYEWQLRVECEGCTTAATLCVAFHKGQTFLGWDVL